MKIALPSLITRLSEQRKPLTVEELAELLRISRRSVYYAIQKSGLPVIRIGSTVRIDPVHAAKWLRARQIR
jgi:excisionase family DNA binding protein